MKRTLLVGLLALAAVAAPSASAGPAGGGARTAAPDAASCSGPCPIVVFGKGNRGGTVESVARYSDGRPDVIERCTVTPGDQCAFFIDEFASSALIRPVSPGFRGWEACPGATLTCPVMPGIAGGVCAVFTVNTSDSVPTSSCPPPYLQVFKKGDGKGTIQASAPSGVSESCEPVCPTAIWTRFAPTETITLTATASEGTFLRWELCPGAEGPVCRVALMNITTVCAVFARGSSWPDTSCPQATPPNPPDTRRPQTRITAGPSPTRATRARRVTFRFTSNERGSRFLCRLDSRAWHSCRSPRTYSRLRPGRHVFRVKAIDRAGNVDGTPALRRWRILR